MQDLTRAAVLSASLLHACAGREENRSLLAPASDLSGIPVPLDPEVGDLQVVEVAPEPAIFAAKTGDTIEVTLSGLPLCDQEPLAVYARRTVNLVQVELRAAPSCGPGRSGGLVLQIEDKPGSYSAKTIEARVGSGAGALLLGPVPILSR